jgi:lysozyme family protein
MADINQFIPFILKWEGGFADTPGDAGGATNMGVTLGTWRQVGYDKTGDGRIDVEDLKRLTADEVVERVLKPHYWDRWRADEIHSQSLAHLLVDWVWASGAPGITIPQQMLGVKADGIVGPKTLAALNGHPDPRELFDRLKAERFLFLGKIVVARPANLKFLVGWINRLNDLNFQVMRNTKQITV